MGDQYPQSALLIEESEPVTCPANNLKLNPDKTEFIIFHLKLYHENLKSCCQSIISVDPFHPAIAVKIWEYGLTQISVFLGMFRVSVRPVLND